ncbi:MAG: hypothetical protein HQ517_17280 [SAR324 cluster bacterium]|nr:hypothetical protein [SAR324 cluster bacterium]
MLDWVIENLIRHGISEIIINTHHLHTTIQAYLRSHRFAIPITISQEKTILGTGHGLYDTIDYWDESDFFVCNVDILCNVNLKNFFDFHRSHNSLVSLGINDRISDSMLLVDEAGFLVGRSLNEQPHLLKRPAGKVFEVGFCGFQTISPVFFSKVAAPMSFSIIDDYMNLLKAGGSIMTWSIGDSYWEDIGTAEALKRANRDFPG